MYGLASPESRGALQFTLTGSRVAIGLDLPAPSGGGKEAPPADQPPVGDVPALLKAKTHLTVTPAETSPVYTVTAKKKFLSTTTVSIAYFDNTRLVKTIGAPVTDNTLKVISSVGGILATVLPLALRKPQIPATDAEKRLTLPIVLDFSEGANLNAALTDAGVTIPGTDEWRYRLRGDTSDGAPRPDSTARPAKAFFDRGGTTNEWPYSACLTGILEIWAKNGKKPFEGDVARFPVTIADPRYVRTVALPAKGAATAHTICGVDVKAENAELPGTLAIIEALAKQADAVYRATAAKK